MTNPHAALPLPSGVTGAGDDVLDFESHRGVLVDLSRVAQGLLNRYEATAEVGASDDSGEFDPFRGDDAPHQAGIVTAPADQVERSHSSLTLDESDVADAELDRKDGTLFGEGYIRGR